MTRRNANHRAHKPRASILRAVMSHFNMAHVRRAFLSPHRLRDRIRRCHRGLVHFRPLSPVKVSYALMNSLEAIRVKVRPVVLFPNEVLSEFPSVAARVLGSDITHEHPQRSEAPQAGVRQDLQALEPSANCQVPFKRSFAVWGIGNYKGYRWQAGKDFPTIAMIDHDAILFVVVRHRLWPPASLSWGTCVNINISG
jgi:hypothetical protein